MVVVVLVGIFGSKVAMHFVKTLFSNTPSNTRACWACGINLHCYGKLSILEYPAHFSLVDTRCLTTCLTNLHPAR